MCKLIKLLKGDAEASLAIVDKEHTSLGLIVRIIIFSPANYWEQIQDSALVCF